MQLKTERKDVCTYLQLKTLFVPTAIILHRGCYDVLGRS